MAMQVWQRADNESGFVLGVNDQAVYRLEFSGKKSRQDVAAAAQALMAGQDPASLKAKRLDVVPLPEIRRLEVSHAKDALHVHALQDGKPIKISFAVPSGTDPKAVIQQIIDHAKFTHPERAEDISVFEAVIAQVILIAVLGVVFGLIYFAALDLEAGKEIAGNGGGRKGRQFKLFLLSLARILGSTGSLALGGLLIVATLAWGILSVVKRPQRLVWGPESV